MVARRRGRRGSAGSTWRPRGRWRRSRWSSSTRRPCWRSAACLSRGVVAVNLAACVAEAGYDALLVDIDPQANATIALGIGKDAPRTVYDVLTGDAALEEIVTATAIDRLSIAPSGPDLAGATVELPRSPG